jgi:hypothetical protein
VSKAKTQNDLPKNSEYHRISLTLSVKQLLRVKAKVVVHLDLTNPLPDAAVLLLCSVKVHLAQALNPLRQVTVVEAVAEDHLDLTNPQPANAVLLLCSVVVHLAQALNLLRQVTVVEEAARALVVAGVQVNREVVDSLII